MAKLDPEERRQRRNRELLQRALRPLSVNQVGKLTVAVTDMTATEIIRELHSIALAKEEAA